MSGGSEFDKLKDQMQTREELEAAIETFRYNADLQAEVQDELSKAYWVRYQSLIKAGFDEGQAFRIIVARGLA